MHDVTHPAVPLTIPPLHLKANPSWRTATGLIPALLLWSLILVLSARTLWASCCGGGGGGGSCDSSKPIPVEVKWGASAYVGWDDEFPPPPVIKIWHRIEWYKDGVLQVDEPAPYESSAYLVEYSSSTIVNADPGTEVKVKTWANWELMGVFAEVDGNCFGKSSNWDFMETTAALVLPVGPDAGFGDAAMDVCSLHLNLGMGGGFRSIWINAPTLAGTDVSADNLRYTGPDVEKVEVNGVLSQVRTAHGLAVITPDSTYGFTVSFYENSQVSGSAPGPYQTAGNPVVSYTVSDPGTGAGSVSHAKLTKSLNGGAAVEIGFYAYDADQNAPNWTLLRPGEGSKQVTRTPGQAAGEYTLEIKTIESRNGNPVVVAEVVESYVNDILFSRRVGPAVGGVTTFPVYDGADKQVGFYDSNGQWEWQFSMTREDDGNREWKAVLQPYGDTTRPANMPNPINPVNVSGHLVLTREVVYSNADGPSHRVGSSRTTEEFKDNVKVRKETVDIDYSGNTEKITTKRWTGPNGAEIVDTSLRYRSDVAYPYGNRAIYREDSGKRSTYTYLEGYLNGQTFVPDANQKTHLEETITETTAGDQGVSVAHVSARTVNLYASTGILVRKDSHICTAVGTPATFSRMARREFTYDGNGNLTQETRDGMVVYSATWNGNLKLSETDEAGTVTEFSNHDGAGRPGTIINKGYVGSGAISPAQPDVVMTVAYDSFGRKISRASTSGGQTLGDASSYDTAGRLVSQTVNGITATYSYAAPAGGVGATVTETLPGNLTRITELYADGSTKSVTGSAVVSTTYVRGVETVGDFAGLEYTRVNRGLEPIWEKSITDWLGRRIAEVKPAPIGPNGEALRTWTYDNQGRMNQEWQGGALGVIFKSVGYDGGAGNETTETSYLGGGMQPITLTSAVTYELDGGVWFRKTTTSVANVVRLVRKEQVGGAPVQSGVAQVGFSETVNEAGDFDRSITYVNRANKLQTIVRARSGMQNTLETRVRNSRIEYSETSADKGISVSTYDALGRLVSTTDPRTGNLWQFTYDGAYPDQVATQTLTVPAGADPAAGQSSTVSQTYYPPNGAHAGRVAIRTENGTQTFYRYSDRGEISQVWGHTYPLRYGYDDEGRLANLYTYRSLPQNFDFTQATWPGGDATTWEYHPCTMALAVKTSAGGDTIRYTYDTFGHLLTQQYGNQATVAATTTYFRDLQGHVTDIVYTGESGGISTPPVEFRIPDALGRYQVITDGAGTRTLTYSSRGVVTSESVTGSPMGSYVIERGEGPWGRVNYVKLLFPGEPDPVTSTTYGYDPVTGRMNSVSGGDFTAEYAYNASSDQVQTTTFKHSGSSVLTSTSTLDGLNRLHRVQNTATSTQMVLNRHTYGYDARHRRTTVEEADGRKWHYGYNDRNEVESGVKKLANGNPVLGHSFGYEFDPIGNRTKTTVNARESIYTPNEENQIAVRTVPGALDILGTSPSSIVRVNGQTPQRQGDDFHQVLNVDNSQQGKWTDVAIKAFSEPPQLDRVKTETGRLHLPKTPQTFTYDEAGNMTSDSDSWQDRRWIYTWDAQNRLVGATDFSVSPAATYTYGYDSESRRIWKKKTVNGIVQEFRRFYYDGWNLIAEALVNPTTGAVTLTGAYTWGVDLSGTTTDAGGIGGLLFTRLEDQGGAWLTAVPLYDGNGNVRALVDAATGVSAGEYSYGPFGEVLRASGALTRANPFRWSTKYSDQGLGLSYYGHRWYSPGLGRWISRDPIEEQGGVNLMGYVGNEATSKVDPIGQAVLIYGEDSIVGGSSATGFAETKRIHDKNRKEALEWVQKAGPRCTFIFNEAPVTRAEFVKFVTDDIMELSGGAGDSLNGDIAKLATMAAKLKYKWDYLGYTKHATSSGSGPLVPYRNEEKARLIGDVFAALQNISFPGKLVHAICKYDPKTGKFTLERLSPTNGDFSTDEVKCIIDYTSSKLEKEAHKP